MKKHLQIFISLCILVLLSLACRFSGNATPVAVTVAPQVDSQQPPFVGLWMSETETLVFTENSLYRVISNLERSETNEQFAEIIAVDISNRHITLRTQWIRVNGNSVGFDAPTYNLTYEINGDTLQIGRGTDTDFATELDTTLYQKK